MQKLTIAILIVAVVNIECHSYDDQDYSIENSDSDSNEIYTNNIEDDDKYRDYEKKEKTTTPAPTEKVEVKLKNIDKNRRTGKYIDVKKTDFVDNKIDKTVKIEKVEKVENFENTDVTEELKENLPSKGILRINVSDAVTPIPPRSLDYCKEKHFMGTYKDDEDKCTSTLINYPFSVSVQKRGSHYTSGALVDKKWILTTAGEFYHVRESIKLFRARLGSVDCKRGGTVVPIKKIELHPSYIYGSPNYDVAMLRMAIPVGYTDYIKPISLSTVKSPISSHAKFLSTYWPRLIVKGNVLPPTAKERVKQNSMRVSTQRMIPWDRCIEVTNTENVTLSETTLCLKPVVTHHSKCMPDAGAPVVADDGLWGVTSGWVSDDCSISQSVTVFSRLAADETRAWLEVQMQPQP